MNVVILHQNIAALFSKLNMLKITLADTFIRSGDESNVHLKAYNLVHLRKDEVVFVL